jgi:hypothetical protein
MNFIKSGLRVEDYKHSVECDKKSNAFTIFFIEGFKENVAEG